LNVRHVLTGTVRRAGDALRITVELVECETDTPVWSEKYSGTVEDVFDLQERISRQVVEALQVVITPEESERLAARPISDVQAYECYLLARQEATRFTLNGISRAEQLLDRAIELAGENALLLALQAWVYAGRHHLTPTPDETLWREAERLLHRALTLDPACATAYWVSGWMGYFDPSNVAQSLRHFHRALEIEPNNPDALLWLSDLYAETGRPVPATEFARRAREVDPLSWLSHAKVVAVHFWSGRKEEAYRES
jgi:tetratricopeptide (TPR) repeat protein